jgi:type VI secretion system protein ImpK
MSVIAPIGAGSAMTAFDAFLAFHHDMVAVIGDVEGGYLSEASAGGLRELRFQVFGQLKAAVLAGGGISGGLGDPHADPRYVMAALADELMLHDVNWDGRTWWADNLLEQHLFRSSISGEKIFRLGRDLVEGKLPGRTDLAMAILLALGLGFRGRYRGVDDGGAIRELRARLYEMIYRRPPPRGIDWDGAMPDVVVPALARDSERRQRPARLRAWLLLIALLTVGYAAASHALWSGVTTELLASARTLANPSLRQP